MSVPLFACRACGHVCFPARQLCHRCGGASWLQVHAADGEVQEVTTVLHQVDAGRAEPCHLASVRAAGVLLLARLDQPADPGTVVVLTMQDGAVLGRST